MADVDEWEQILGNPAIEKAAIEFVIECERRQGRTAKDARGSGRGGAGDVESVGDVESDGRIIEVKASGGWWRTGLLYFTPSQVREGVENPNYYVYIVENVTQGDPSKFEVSMLHGEDLKRLFAGAKVHRLYVTVHAADKARLPRLVCVEPDQPRVGDENAGGHSKPVSPEKRPVEGRRKAHPIRDMDTGKEYRAKAEAGRDLYHLVGGDPKDQFVWFKILRAFPDRFQTKNAAGEWVALDDPTAPVGTTLPDS